MDHLMRTQSSAAEVRCQWCGFQHIDSGVCPRVKAMEYHEDGTLKRIEFHEPAPPEWLATHLTGLFGPTSPTTTQKGE